jgi:CysZ protein
MPALNPSDFVKGVSYAFRGMGILRKYPGLARYWSIPILLTLAALVASVVLSVRYHDDLLRLVWAEPIAHDTLSRILRGLYWLARVLTFIASFGLLVVVCAVLSTLAAAPFNDALSEAIELREAGRTPPPFSLTRLLADGVRTVALEALKLSALVLLMGPLWLLSFLVPGVGQLIYAGVGAFITCVYFALDYIDWPASRRGLSIRERLSLFWQRPWLMLGFGAAVWACLFVPFLNLAFMPIAVAGGTRLFLDLEGPLQS